jgi:predicted Fe-S protein YdhL (DUF1289 family)
MQITRGLARGTLLTAILIMTATAALAATTSLADSMGPLVIAADGTASRISNWANMTDNEKKTTMRVLTARNRKRIDALKEAKAAVEAAGEATTKEDSEPETIAAIGPGDESDL